MALTQVAGGMIAPSTTLTTPTINTITSASGSALTLQSNGGTTAVTVDTSQNVGVGTTSPAAKFHSAGGIIATGSASAFTATAGIMDTSGGNARITATGADSSTYGVLTFNRGSSNASLFQESMRIDSSGNLLVGTTSAPANKGLVNLASNKTYQVNGTSVSALAWVNFNGTVGPDATRRASYNVSSVTKNSTGDYTVNFANALTDANYSATATNSGSGATAEYSAGILSMTSSAVRVHCFKSGVGAGDPTYFCVTVHGN